MRFFLKKGTKVMRKSVASIILVFTLLLAACGTKDEAVIDNTKEYELSSKEELAEIVSDSSSIAASETATSDNSELDNGEDLDENADAHSDESDGSINATNVFITLNEKVNDTTYQCALSIPLEFNIDDIDSAKPGDKLVSVGGNEYEVVSASDVLIYMQGDDSGLDSLLQRTHWLSIGIIDDGEYEFLRKTEDNRVVAQYIESDATVVENASSVILTVAEDAEVVLDNLTYSGDKLTISGSEFVAIPLDYSTQKVDNIEFCVCSGQCGYADISDGVITRFVAEWVS